MTLLTPPLNSGSAQDNSSNTVQIAIIEDGMSLRDMQEWYSVYKGCYLWGKEFDFSDAEDYSVISQRMIAVRDKILPEKGNKSFQEATYEVLKKYEDPEFDFDSKNKLIDDLFYISEGLRLAMDAVNE